MEFWGLEIKPGQTIKVPVEDEMILRISHAALGEHKKATGNDSIILSVKVAGKSLVLGTLSAGKIPHISFDLVFDKEIELSHNWKNGSVYFAGYMTMNESFFRSATEGDDFDGMDDSDEEDMQLQVENEANGNPEPKAVKAKAAAKPSVPVDDESDDDSEESSDEDDYVVAERAVDSGDSEGSDDSDDMSDDSDEDEMDEDEETPKKAEPEKKKANDSAIKTPVPAKKVKVAYLQKTDGKKGAVHTATPHPKKAVAKTPAANADKPKAPATPKSGGSLGCNSCSKKSNSGKALKSHSKAKHAAK